MLLCSTTYSIHMECLVIYGERTWWFKKINIHNPHCTVLCNFLALKYIRTTDHTVQTPQIQFLMQNCLHQIICLIHFSRILPKPGKNLIIAVETGKHCIGYKIAYAAIYNTFISLSRLCCCHCCCSNTHRNSSLYSGILSDNWKLNFPSRQL